MIAVHIFTWVAVALLVLVVGGAFRTHRQQQQRNEISVRTAMTLKQVVRNREKVDDQFRRIKEEQHAVRRKLNRADLDSPDVDDTPFAGVIEAKAKGA